MPKETFFRLRDEKQESILRSAIHEFVEHGFERAKISDIAKNAHVATGSIYQYFEDKNELFMYCAEWGTEVFMQKIDFRTDVKSMDIFEYFDERINKTEVMDEEREMVAFMQEISKHPDMMQSFMRNVYEKTDEYINILIQNSKDRGLVRTDIDNGLLKEFFIAVTERFKLRWLKKEEDFAAAIRESGELNREANQMMELLKHGLSGEK